MYLTESSTGNSGNIAWYGAETWAFLDVDQKYPENIELCCWTRVKKIIWTDQVKIKVSHRAKEGQERRKSD